MSLARIIIMNKKGMDWSKEYFKQNKTSKLYKNKWG